MAQESVTHTEKSFTHTEEEFHTDKFFTQKPLTEPTSILAEESLTRAVTRTGR